MSKSCQDNFEKRHTFVESNSREVLLVNVKYSQWSAYRWQGVGCPEFVKEFRGRRPYVNFGNITSLKTSLKFGAVYFMYEKQEKVCEIHYFRNLTYRVFSANPIRDFVLARNKVLLLDTTGTVSFYELPLNGALRPFLVYEPVNSVTCFDVDEDSLRVTVFACDDSTKHGNVRFKRLGYDQFSDYRAYDGTPIEHLKLERKATLLITVAESVISLHTMQGNTFQRTQQFTSSSGCIECSRRLGFWEGQKNFIINSECDSLQIFEIDGRDPPGALENLVNKGVAAAVGLLPKLCSYDIFASLRSRTINNATLFLINGTHKLIVGVRAGADVCDFDLNTGTLTSLKRFYTSNFNNNFSSTRS